MFYRILLGAALVVALMAAPAYGQYATIVVSPGTVVAGEMVTVTGAGCTPNAAVTVSVSPQGGGASIATASATTNDDGAFSASVTIPVETTPGTYLVTATDCPGSTTLEVLGTTAVATTPGTPGTPNTPGGVQGNQGNVGGSNQPLPRTGSDLDRLGLIGAALLASGAMFLVATKHRRSLRHRVA